MELPICRVHGCATTALQRRLKKKKKATATATATTTVNAVQVLAVTIQSASSTCNLHFFFFVLLPTTPIKHCISEKMYLKFWLRTRFLFFVFLFLSTFQGSFPYSRWHYKVKETNLLFFFFLRRTLTIRRFVVFSTSSLSFFIINIELSHVFFFFFHTRFFSPSVSSRKDSLRCCWVL